MKRQTEAGATGPRITIDLVPAVALGLDHVEVRADTDVDNYNLMYPALRAGNRLTQNQLNQARRSPLATELGATTR